MRNTHRLPRRFAVAVVGAVAVLLGVSVVALASPALAAGSARLVATPRPVAFGSVVVGHTAGTTVTVTNSGSAATAKALHVALAGTGFAVTRDACTGRRLAAGTSCTVQVSFTPTAAASSRGMLTVSAGLLSTGAIAVTGTGTGAPVARLSVSPATETFPATGTGQRSDLVTFTVTNAGTATAGAISTSRPGADFPVFSDTCTGIALAPHASCSYTAAFVPQSRGARTGTLTAAATPGGTAQAALSGTGLAQAQLSVSGTQSFPDTNVGAQSDAVTHTVSNGGDLASGPITVGAFATADFTVSADRCSGQSLAAGATCSIAVQFSPQAFGVTADVLSVRATPGGGVNLPLTGTGLGTPTLTISPDDYSFPNTPVGTDSLVQVFTVTNEGTGPAWYNSDATSSDINSVYFYTELAPAMCTFGQELDPGQSCNVAASAFPHVGGALTGFLNADFYDSPDAMSGAEYTAQAVLRVTGV